MASVALFCRAASAGSTQNTTARTSDASRDLVDRYFESGACTGHCTSTCKILQLSWMPKHRGSGTWNVAVRSALPKDPSSGGAAQILLKGREGLLHMSTQSECPTCMEVVGPSTAKCPWFMLLQVDNVTDHLTPTTIIRITGEGRRT